MVLADKLGLSATIAQLPAGYQTSVGNNDNQMLNQGAIKLITIVRALAQSPSILLLDEPMVSLDADSQQRLLALLLELKNHITLIVASYFTEITAISDYRIHISSQGDATMSSNGEL